MKELEQAIVKAFQNSVENGKLQEVIQKHLDSSLSSIIESMFGYCGSLKKDLEEHVKSSLKVDFTRVNLQNYNQLIIDQAKAAFDKQVKSIALEHFNKSLESCVSDYSGDMKLSDLVDEIKEYRRGWDNNCYGENCTCIVERDSRSIEIYLDEKENKDKWRCDIHIRVHEDNNVWWFQCESTEYPSKKVTVGPLGTLERKLFYLYASDAKLIVDEDDVNTYYDYED